MFRHRARAFSLVDLCVLLFLIALIVAASVRANHAANGSNARVKCGSNLRQIGQAIQIYANENRGAFPRATFDRAVEPVPTQYTGVNATDPFGPGGPEPNDVSAPLFLLLRVVDITPEVFVCPSSDGNTLFGKVRAALTSPAGRTCRTGTRTPTPAPRPGRWVGS